MLTRRQFLQAAVAAGAAAAVPPVLESFLQSARATTENETGYFLTPERWATCRALCARIVPTGSDPAADPGATEAHAVVFIDRFLAAFELPSTLADNPAIYVTGRWSGRNPFEADGGHASTDYPPDDFLDDNGQAHFLALTPLQALSWKVQLYGTEVLATAPAYTSAWAKQLGSLIPVSPGLRRVYADGLDAFDSWSRSTFGTPFAEAATQEQDAMLALAGNVVLDAVTGNLPVSLPTPPAPPAAASALMPVVTLHAYQATYGIPEYAWRNQDNDPSVEKLGGTSQWRELAYDGDTQPLGNSLFDAGMYGPGEGPNAGFGAEPGSADEKAGVYVPFGGYREFRPVSTLGPGGTVIGAAEAEQIRQFLIAARGRK